MPEIGKIFISVDHGKFHDDECPDAAVRAVLSRVRGVYCVLFFGKQRAKTPPIPGLNSLSWSAFEFEFSVIEESSKLSVSLYAQLEEEHEGEGPPEDMLLCSWNEDTELLEDGNYERWVELCANEVELCRLQLHLRMECSRRVEDSVGLEDFDELTAIGEGAFGKVLTVRKCDTGKIYAMKVLEKGRVQSKRQLMRMLGERNILMKVHSPFIVGLHFAFQTADKVYLILDFVGGGDLFYHLKLHKRFTESCVQFWAAEIVCALEALHANSIVYRDLKPENILLEPDGHIVLVDFGLAKQMQHSVVHGVEGRSNSFVGTPEYLAPEVVQGTGHTMTVDWWTLGILLFELLLGKPPFKAKDLSILYQRIVAEDVVVPPNKAVEELSPECRSIVRGFLNRNPNTRLGNQGAAQVRNHPFFSTIDWPNLEQKKLRPPYTPLSPVDYLQKVFCMVKEEPSTPKASEPPTTQPPPGHSTHKTVSSSPPPPGESSLLYQATSSTAPTGSKTISSGPVVPDYFASIVTLIEKWQTRILEIPNVLEEDPTAPRTALGSRSHDSNDSNGSLRESASVDSKHSPKMGSKKNSSRGGSRKASQEQKQLVGETIIKVAVSPGISPALTAANVDTKGQGKSMLAGLLFGPEVLDLETMIREMQEKLEAQQEQLISQDKELCGAKAERELLKAQLLTVTAKSTSSSSAGNESSSAGDSPKGSPKGTAAEALQGGHIMPADESSQLHIVQEETKSLMNLANKMAAVMATSVGPVGDEIADILCEAQTLMGLARQEREAVTPEPDNSRNWEEMVQQKTANMMKEQKTQERMSKLANQLSETEDSYMHAMAESQKTLATAAVERDALLQLASKLEEQTRVQSEREGRVVEMFNHKCQELDALAQELKRVQENEARLLEERESLLSEVQEARRLESKEQNKSESHMIESPKSQSPKSPPSLNRQSSWPNPIKWLMGDSKKKQDDDFSEPSGDEEEDDDEEEEEDSPVFEPEEGESARSSVHSSVTEEWDKRLLSEGEGLITEATDPTAAEAHEVEGVGVRYYEAQQQPERRSCESSREQPPEHSDNFDHLITSTQETNPSLLVVM